MFDFSQIRIKVVIDQLSYTPVSPYKIFRSLTVTVRLRLNTIAGVLMYEKPPMQSNLSEATPASNWPWRDTVPVNHPPSY